MSSRIKAATGTAVCLALISLASCITSKPPRPEPLSGHDLQIFMSNSRDPEMSGVELIRGSEGVFARNVYKIRSSRKVLLKFRSPRKSALPVVKVEPRSGGGCDMLIDTSSRKSWIEFEQAEDFELVPIGPRPERYKATHLRDSINGILTMAPYLRFRKMLISDALLYVRADHATLWPISRSHDDPEVEAVMGCGMMKAFAFIVINYKDREVMLFGEDEYPVNRLDFLTSLPIEWENGAIAVDALLDGKRQKVFIDTGGDYALARPAGDTSPCKHLFLGDVAVIDPELADSKQLGIDLRDIPSIGGRILKNYVLVIDMARQEIHLQQP